MPNDPKNLVDELEKLESQIEIVRISSNDENWHYLEDYVREHNRIQKGEEGDRAAEGNFNEYLQQKLKQERPELANKVVVAEITGDIGMSPQYLGIEEGYDEQYKEDIKLNFEGADLSGSRLTDIAFHKSLKGVNLRDCFFENVFFDGCNLSEVDFRGTKLKNCEFLGYGKLDGTKYIPSEGVSEKDQERFLESLKLDFANASAPQMFNLFRIEEYPEGRFQEEKKIKRDTQYELDAAIAKFKKEKYADQSYAAYGLSYLYTTGTQQKLNEEIEEGIRKLEEKYKGIEEKRLYVEANKHLIPLDTVQYDPTYIPKDKERAEAKKVLLKATQEDLENYIAFKKAHSEQQLSFNEFIAQKAENEEILANAQKKSPEVKIIPVADFYFGKEYQTIKGLDLSELSLGEVNFAYVKFKDCQFEKAELTGSCFEGASFKGKTSFKEAILTDSSFVGASGQNVDFSNALMPRVRMMCSEFKGSKFEKALLYSADLTGSDIEGAVLKNADARHADLEKVNMRYVDAQYVNMRGAKLKKAILDDANFSHADLKDAVMKEVSAKKTNFKEAILENAKLEYANLKGAILEEVKAKGAKLTGADLEEAKLQLADLSNAVMDKVNAQLADFTKATLNDVHAHQADFSEAVMEGIKGERLDVSKSILHETNLRHAKLKNAVMREVDAYKADLHKAVLEDVQAENAKMIACDFSEAKMQRMEVEGAILNMSQMEGANCTGMKFNEGTLVLDVNFRNTTGADGLKKLQEEQHKINSQLFGRSQYGACNKDEGADRFKCQRIGAAVLSTVIGGGTGYALSGPLAGISGAVVAGLVSDRALVAIKDGYFKEQGYISNQLGDKLAKLGTIAIATGAGSLEAGAIPIAATLCVATGLISPQSVGLVAGGAVTTYFGAKTFVEGFQEQSRIKKWGGAILTALGAGATAVGLTSIGQGINLFAGTVLCGAAYGGVQGGLFAYKQLKAYDKKKQTGMRPEEIYQVSIQKGKDAFKKIWPAWNKVISACVYATMGATLELVLAHSISIIAALSGITYLTFSLSMSSTLGTLGLTGGYIFDESLSFWKGFNINDIKNYFSKDSLKHSTVPEAEISKEQTVAHEPLEKTQHKEIIPSFTKEEKQVGSTGKENIEVASQQPKSFVEKHMQKEGVASQGEEKSQEPKCPIKEVIKERESQQKDGCRVKQVIEERGGQEKSSTKKVIEEKSKDQNIKGRENLLAR